MPTSSILSSDCYLRYENESCSCCDLAEICVAELQPNEGRLYYTCRMGECGYFSWCDPVGYAVTISDGSTSTTFTEWGDQPTTLKQEIEALTNIRKKRDKVLQLQEKWKLNSLKFTLFSFGVFLLVLMLAY